MGDPSGGDSARLSRGPEARVLLLWICFGQAWVSGLELGYYEPGWGEILGSMQALLRTIKTKYSVLYSSAARIIADLGPQTHDDRDPAEARVWR